MEENVLALKKKKSFHSPIVPLQSKMCFSSLSYSRMFELRRVEWCMCRVWHSTAVFTPICWKSTFSLCSSKICFFFVFFFLGGITSQSHSGVQHAQNVMWRLEDFQRTLRMDLNYKWRRSNRWYFHIFRKRLGRNKTLHRQIKSLNMCVEGTCDFSMTLSVREATKMLPHTDADVKTSALCPFYDLWCN